MGQEAGQNIRRTILLEEGPDSSMMQIQYLKGRDIVESSWTFGNRESNDRMICKVAFWVNRFWVAAVSEFTWGAS